MDERRRLIIPFRKVADHTGAILHAVIPLGGPSNGGIHVIAQHDEDRNAIAPGVVDGHGCMLQADRSVRQDRQGLPFHLEIAMGHRDG